MPLNQKIKLQECIWLEAWMSEWLRTYESSWASSLYCIHLSVSNWSIRTLRERIDCIKVWEEDSRSSSSPGLWFHRWENRPGRLTRLEPESWKWSGVEDGLVPGSWLPIIQVGIWLVNSVVTEKQSAGWRRWIVPLDLSTPTVWT